VRAIETMIGDALLHAAPFLNLAETLEDPEAYCRLDDSILGQIEYSSDASTGGDAGMRSARALIKDLRHRRLYRLVDEVILLPPLSDRVTSSTAADIASCVPTGCGVLDPDDLIVDHVTMSYSMRDRNPVDSIRFFSDWGSQDAFFIERSSVSRLIPDNFQERVMRVYLRPVLGGAADATTEHARMETAKAAFRTWRRQVAVRTPVVSAGLSRQGSLRGDDALGDAMRASFSSSQQNASAAAGNGPTLTAPGSGSAFRAAAGARATVEGAMRKISMAGAGAGVGLRPSPVRPGAPSSSQGSATIASSSSSSNGNADTDGASGTGASGTGASGTGASGTGASGTGASGAGASGAGASGAGASGTGASGAGASGAVDAALGDLERAGKRPRTDGGHPPSNE
jgi:hypothetical protein